MSQNDLPSCGTEFYDTTREEYVMVEETRPWGNRPISMTYESGEWFTLTIQELRKRIETGRYERT